MNLTNHAKKRLKERCGISKGSASMMTERAYERGVPHNELTGELQKWVNFVYLTHKSAGYLCIYGSQLYVFKNQALITVLNVPNELRDELADAKAKHTLRSRLRNHLEESKT